MFVVVPAEDEQEVADASPRMLLAHVTGGLRPGPHAAWLRPTLRAASRRDHSMIRMAGRFPSLAIRALEEEEP
jgi:hypothetical protein